MDDDSKTAFKNSGILIKKKEEILPLLFSLLGTAGLVVTIFCAIPAVWLLFVGEWRFVVLGIIVGLIFSWIEPLVISPAFGLVHLGTFLRKKVFIVSFLLILIAIAYQQLLMVAWSLLVMIFTTSAYSDHHILLILFGLAVVMMPLIYIAKNDEGLGTAIGLSVAFVSYVIQAIFFLTGDMPIFVWCLLIFLVATISIQGVAGYKNLKVVD